jgi:hypothetical protein
MRALPRHLRYIFEKVNMTFVYVRLLCGCFADANWNLLATPSVP